MQARYELFDHTADVGVRVYAATMAGLVEPATGGLYEVIGELVAAVTGSGEQASFEMAGDEPPVMLRDYLAEVLQLFETGKRMVTAVNVAEFSERRLAVAVETRPLDAERSEYAREVKAVTYHELRIRPLEDGFEATYIVDI
jgi:SHS2 domain-containing protein